MAAKKTSTRKTPKTIRNLRGTVVHLRLFGTEREKPYRIELAPRGQVGDTHTVPVALQDDGTYHAGLGVLFEVITTTEARNLKYAPPGQLQRDQAELMREQDNLIQKSADWDGRGRVPERPIGPPRVNVPGSDPALSDAALPPGVDFDRKVTVEKVRDPRTR